MTDERPEAYPLCAGSSTAAVRFSVPRTFRPGSCIVAPGAFVSRCHDQLAGLASVLPAMSVARTSTVRWPSVRPVNVLGLVQALQPPPSTRHSKVEPASVDAKPNVAGTLLGSPGTTVKLVSGGVESTVTSRIAAARCPALSAATASSAWLPSPGMFQLVL